MAAYYYNRAREWNKAVTIDTKDRAYLAGSVLDFEKLHPRGPREILKGIWEAEESIGSTWGYSAENPVERFRGAQAVILGCTEITLLIKASDVDIPVLDTTALHAGAAVDFALQT